MPTKTVAVRNVRISSFVNDLLDKEVHASANTKLVSIIGLAAEELGKAKMAIDQKYMEIGGATGQPVGGVQYGAGDGFLRQYQHGVIYYLPPSGPCWVHGAILEKYQSLGAEGGFLGYPTTDELTAPDGAGRYNHFQRGSIYWSYTSGAHEVHGAIRDRWASLGWEKSWLGYPKSDEIAFAEAGRCSIFEKGAIYWWSDTGAIELGDIAVRYKGLYCFGETRGLGADEPYVIFGSVPVPPVQPDGVRSQIYDDVDSGDARPDSIELYRGVPGGFATAAWLYEHDYSDPDHYLGLVKEGVALAGKGVKAACVALIGQEAAAPCEAIWGAVAGDITTEVNDFLDTKDDLLGTASLTLSAKEMVILAGTPRQNFWGIEYHRESGLISDGDASYKIYLDVTKV